MPTFYRTGVDAAGRSAVVERCSLALDIEPFQLHTEPPIPTVPSSTSSADLLEARRDAGTARWSVYVWRPGQHTELHRTHSVDVDIVLHGSLDLILESEVVTLGIGDCVLLPGNVHAWRSGPIGAIVCYSIVQAAEPEVDSERPRATIADIMHVPGDAH